MSNHTKILVVDDEPIGRQLLEAILVPEGYELSYGKDGEEALTIALQELPDIILMDVMMPKMDGFEVCKKLRENESTAHIPIYLITALDDRDSRIRGIDAGAYDYLSKPFDRVEILAKIKNISYQVSLQKKNSGEKDTSKNISGEKKIDPGLLSSLFETILYSETDSKYFEVYPPKSQVESSTAFTRKIYEHGQYTILVSNTLKGENAVISNCIFLSILYKNIEKWKGQPKNIIQQSYQALDAMVKNSKNDTLNPAQFSTVIIFQNNNNQEVTASGHNQYLFLLAGPESQEQNYQLCQLQNNQEYNYKEVNVILAFAQSVYSKTNPKVLLDILNEMQQNSNQVNLGQLANDKLEPDPDLLIVKLSF